MRNDDDLRTYKNYSKILPVAKLLKHEVYENIISDLKDLSFLKLQLGIYYEEYIIKLNENKKNIGEIVLDDIASHNYEDVKIKAILRKKDEAENLISLRFKTEISNRKKGKKPGKPATEIKPFKENITKNWSEKGKEAFVGVIKQEFIDVKDKYKNNKKKYLYLLALAIKNLEVVNENIEDKHLIHTVGNLFINHNEKITNSDVSGFGSRAKTIYTSDSDYIKYKNRIETIVNNRMKVYEL